MACRMKSVWKQKLLKPLYKGMYYISSFLLITNGFKSFAFVDDVYFFSFSHTVSIRFNEFLWNMCNAKT